MRHIKQIRYKCGYGRSSASVISSTGRKWTYQNVSQASRERLGRIDQYPFEQAQNEVYSPGFVVWRAY